MVRKVLTNRVAANIVAAAALAGAFGATTGATAHAQDTAPGHPRTTAAPSQQGTRPAQGGARSATSRES